MVLLGRDEIEIFLKDNDILPSVLSAEEKVNKVFNKVSNERRAFRERCEKRLRELGMQHFGIKTSRM